jgi:2-dehydropantoate 2-reductase
MTNRDPHGRILIVGPGAVGGTVAAWLAQAGRNVALAVRTPFRRLSVETPSGRLEAELPIVTDVARAGAAEWVLIAVKAYEAETAARWLEPFSSGKARIAILQNGVEHVSRFAPFIPRDRLLPVMVDIPAERDAPGRIRQRGAGIMQVPAGAAGSAFAALFAGTALKVEETADFTSALWRKLCINVAGAVPVLTGEMASVARRPPAERVMRELVAECIAVGRAEGAELDDGLADMVIRHYRAAPPDSLNSMHADRLAGRPMEWDARNGVVARLGRRHGIATPVSDTVAGLLAAIDERVTLPSES